MKKVLTFLAILLCSGGLRAQQTINQVLTLNSNGVNSTEILMKKQDNVNYNSISSNSSGIGIYNSTTNKHILYANYNDFVGIGTINPATKLQVQKDGVAPAITIGGGNSGSPRLQIYGLTEDANAWMGLGTDMSGNPYEHSIYFPTAPSGYIGRLSIGNFNGATYHPRVMVLDNGNVGIGTTAPQSKLHVSGKRVMFSENGGEHDLLFGDEMARYFSLHTPIGANRATLKNYTNNIDIITFIQNGDVGIGTTTPKEKLSVNGKIRAHEVKVETANWPDYVFEDGYKPKSLQEIDEFVKLNKHLPEVPSAKEVAQNGIELGEMNKILLKKIEELTLHLIAKDKQVEQQDLAIKALSKQMQELQNLVKSNKE